MSLMSVIRGDFPEQAKQAQSKRKASKQQAVIMRKVKAKQAKSKGKGSLKQAITREKARKWQAKSK